MNVSSISNDVSIRFFGKRFKNSWSYNDFNEGRQKNSDKKSCFYGYVISSSVYGSVRDFIGFVILCCVCYRKEAGPRELIKASKCYANLREWNVIFDIIDFICITFTFLKKIKSVWENKTMTFFMSNSIPVILRCSDPILVENSGSSSQQNTMVFFWKKNHRFSSLGPASLTLD